MDFKYYDEITSILKKIFENIYSSDNSKNNDQKFLMT